MTTLILLAAFGVALLLFLIVVVRLQAFVALLLVSLVVAVLGGVAPGEVADVIREGMGGTLGYIAIVVGLGAMFGEILQVSGGAELVASTLLRRAGEARAPWALALTGLVVAIPVFFDVALILLLPLVYSLGRRTGRSLLYYALPLAAGIAVAHSFIPPTPGPVAVAALIGADLGWVILFGFLAGVPATILGGIVFGRYIAGRIHLEVPDFVEAADAERKPTEKLPGFGLVVALIAVPLVLILLNTALDVWLPEDAGLRAWAGFIGHPFTALLLALLLAFYFLGTRQGYTRDEIQRIATKALEPVGMIILMTGAGGVFGKVLVATGIGEALAGMMAATHLPLVLLAFLISVLVRVSQGSATVAMVTAAGLVAPIIAAGTYSAPMLGAVTIAIAAGATVLSHVNDSGFWLVSRFLGLSTEQALRSWTVLETILGLVGFAVVLGLSFFL